MREAYERASKRFAAERNGKPSQHTEQSALLRVGSIHRAVGLAVCVLAMIVIYVIGGVCGDH